MPYYDYRNSPFATAFDESYFPRKAQGYYPHRTSYRDRFDYFDHAKDPIPEERHIYNLRSKSGYKYRPSLSSILSSSTDGCFFDKPRSRTGLFGESSLAPFSSACSSPGGYYFTKERRLGRSESYRDEYDVPPRPRYTHRYRMEERRPSGASSSSYSSYSSPSYSSYSSCNYDFPRYSSRGYPTAERRPGKSSTLSHMYSSDGYEYESPPWSTSSSGSSRSSWSSRGYATGDRRPGGCYSSSSSSSSYYSPPPRSTYGSSSRPSPSAEPSGIKPSVCLYVVLGVPRTATLSDIKKAHRKLSMKWHPDRAKGSGKESATEKMAQINQANDILSDEKARAFYDRTGKIQGVDI